MTAPLALLFDLDGTLVDTDGHHIGAWNTLLAESGRSLSLDEYRRRIMGAPNDAIMEHLFPDHTAAAQAELADRKEALFRASLSRLHPAPGLLDLLDWAERFGVACGVVTNAPRLNAELMLAGLELASRFEVLVIGEELLRAKPDPLPYVTGLDHLGAHASRTFAFEDSLSGLRSASAAGLHVYGIRTSLPDATLLAAGAAAVIDDFNDAAMLATLEAARLGLSPRGRAR